MKKLMIFVGVVIALLALIAGGLLWALKDPNRFKPELEALVQSATGMDIALDGDLAWQLWPPVVLKGENIGFEDEQTSYRVGTIGVKADLMQLLSGGGQLAIAQLRISDLLMTDKQLGDRTRINSLRLDDFAPGEPSALHVQATLESDDGPASELTVDGMLSFFSAEDRLTLNPMTFDYDGTRGTCDLAASELLRDPSIKQEKSKEDVLSLDTFRAMNWLADCQVPEYTVDGATLRNITIRTENKDARSTNRVAIPEAFGGNLSADIAIDTRSRTPVWRVTTQADKLQSQALMDLLAPRLRWVAPLLAGGEFTLRGNTVDALLNSMSGGLEFDSNAGQMDIAAIKAAVLGLAQLAGKGDKVDGWPDQLQYTELGGRWQVNGLQQDLAIAIDNVTLSSRGLLNAISGEMDMLSSITIERHPTLDVLPIDDDLYGLAVPMRCSGSLEAPRCGLDANAAKQSLAAHAAGKARGEIDDKLNEAIEEKVPEEYRETAKDALKSLGDLFGGKKNKD